jgi:amino acid transporter
MSSTTATGSGGIVGLATAMVPVLFAYGGWQTASFVSGEMRDPRRDLPRGLLIGVIGVIALYLTVTFVCVRVLGMDDLAATATPASEIMRRALGERGARLIALGIAISTVGFLSQSILTAPRVYYAMARDGVFFRAIGTLDARTRAPVAAIVLQGVWAAVIAMTGKYDQILNYVVSIDVLFFGLTGAALIVLRKREPAPPGSTTVPLHPLTTLIFVLAWWAISARTIVQYPANAGIGVGILALGVIVFQFWRGRLPRRKRSRLVDHTGRAVARMRPASDAGDAGILIEHVPPVPAIAHAIIDDQIDDDITPGRESSVVHILGIADAPLSVTRDAVCGTRAVAPCMTQCSGASLIGGKVARGL